MSATGSYHDFPLGQAAPDLQKYSQARRAADAHSIIFEEDLDSEGELEHSTYDKKPVRNFDLNEERIGHSIENETETDRLEY